MNSSIAGPQTSDEGGPKIEPTAENDSASSASATAERASGQATVLDGPRPAEPDRSAVETAIRAAAKAAIDAGDDELAAELLGKLRRPAAVAGNVIDLSARRAKR